MNKILLYYASEYNLAKKRL